MSVDIFNIDCVEYMKGCDDNAFDLAIVDPPYGIISRQLRGIGSRIDPTGKMNNWNGQKPDSDYFSELFRVSKEQIIWGANNFSLPETEYFCIWDKFQTVDNFASAEYAWVSMNHWKKPAKVFRHPISGANPFGKIHPTQKPVKLYEWLLSNYAEPGQRIFDSHLGSGSNAIAAHYGCFDFVGCEIDTDYYNAAVMRFNDETRQEALFNYDYIPKMNDQQGDRAHL